MADQYLFPCHGHLSAVYSLSHQTISNENLYISSLLLFSIGVVLNGFAQSFTVMMLGRIMQAAGIIVDHWGWRMIFYSLAVLCIIALVVAFFAMDNVLENEHSKLDILSAILAVTGFTGILYGISNLGKGSIFQPVFRSVFDHIPSHNFRCARQHHLYVSGSHTRR